MYIRLDDRFELFGNYIIKFIVNVFWCDIDYDFCYYYCYLVFSLFKICVVNIIFFFFLIFIFLLFLKCIVNLLLLELNLIDIFLILFEIIIFVFFLCNFCCV